MLKKPMKMMKGHIFSSGVFMIPLQRLRILFGKGEQNIKTVFIVISLSLGRAYILSKVADRLLNMVDQLGGLFVGIMALFCFLELYYNYW